MINSNSSKFPYGFMIVTVLKINRTTATIIPIPIITSMQYIRSWFNTTLTGVLRSVGGRPATRDTRLTQTHKLVHTHFSILVPNQMRY